MVRLAGRGSTIAFATSTFGRDLDQKSHPPIWIPGSGSSETMEWVAQEKYTYMVLPTRRYLSCVVRLLIFFRLL